MMDYLKNIFADLGAKATESLRVLTSGTAIITLIGVVVFAVLVWNAAPVAANGERDTVDMWHRAAWLVLCCVPLILFHRGVVPKGYFSGRRLVMLVTMLLLQMLLMLGASSLGGALDELMADPDKQTAATVCYGIPLIMPYVLAPAVASILVDSKFGTFAALCSTVLGMQLFPDNMPCFTLVEFVAVNFLVGIVGAKLAGKAHKREQILYSGTATGLLVFTSVVLLLLCHRTIPAENVPDLNIRWYCIALMLAVGSNFLLMIIVGGLMPMLEKIFNISTHITWLEWADMNHALLKNLQMSAPGTFHHSLYVQRLAEAAAEAIGADVTRAGVCALYHDIGKLDAPQYFAENIHDQSASPHLALTPEASARIITGHVQQGVELARTYKLNRRIIAVIREHHGVSTAYFFYRKAMDNYEEELRKFDEGLTDVCPKPVDKAVFSYKGPIPQTRESGIVSMADAVESATRSLHHPTEEDIRNMVEGIFKGRILDGHLQDSGLTLGDIALMKESFFNTLRTMNHSRIAYPKSKDDDAVTKLSQERKKSSAAESPAKAS